MHPRLLLVFGLIITAASFRFLPHWPNFTPVAAMALFGGAYLERKWMAFFVPLTAMLISDIFLGLHYSMWSVYLAFSLTVMIGMQLRSSATAGRVVTASVSSAVLFFLVTNFGAWLGSPIYPQNFGGLITSYIAGLAFFHNGSLGLSFFLNDLVGTLFYSGIFFGAFSFVEKRFPAFTRTA